MPVRSTVVQLDEVARWRRARGATRRSCGESDRLTGAHPLDTSDTVVGHHEVASGVYVIFAGNGEMALGGRRHRRAASVAERVRREGTNG